MMGPQMAKAHPAGEKNLSGGSAMFISLPSSPFEVLSSLPPENMDTVLPMNETSVTTCTCWTKHGTVGEDQ